MINSVFVTGASSGLGKEVALGFAIKGYRVFAGVRKIEDAQQLMGDGRKITPVVLDLRNRKQIEDAATFVDRECGVNGLSLLINMAGYNVIAPFEFTKEESARDLFEVLLFGPAALTKSLLPALKRNFETHDTRPKVMNIISWAAIDVNPFVGFYSSAKAAFLRLSEAQFIEFQSFGIDAIAIVPGTMKTPMVTEKAGVVIETTLASLPADGRRSYGDGLSRMAEMGRAAQTSSMIPKAAGVAKRILQIAEVKNPRSRYLVGADTRLVNLLTKIVPLRLLELMKSKLFNIVRIAPSSANNVVEV
jgi:NAD(P)-dependent dehydrogenase (short-subunit alcohol dehydrogenase family)